MNEPENMTAREAMHVMRDAVTRELDDLHRERRDHLDVIKSQERQLKMMRESVEYATELKMKAVDIADLATVWLIIAWALAFIAIGYAVWVG